jgi:hypothetical protein
MAPTNKSYPKLEPEFPMIGIDRQTHLAKAEVANFNDCTGCESARLSREVDTQSGESAQLRQTSRTMRVAERAVLSANAVKTKNAMERSTSAGTPSAER